MADIQFAKNDEKRAYRRLTFFIYDLSTSCCDELRGWRRRLSALSLNRDYEAVLTQTS
jgi:hypothetical protein